MTAQLDQELERILQRREQVKAELGRLRGRKEQAEKSLRAVEEEIRARGIEPDEIEGKLQQLEERYRAVVQELERDTDAAERALIPFTKGVV